MPTPLIALISATPLSMAPAAAAFRQEFPEATLWNVLDDRLLTEAGLHGAVTDDLAARMRRLIDHTLAEGVDAVLLTCSMYGPVTRTVAGAGVPVLPSDDAAFAAVLTGEVQRVLVIASLGPSLDDSCERLGAAAEQAGVRIQIDGAVSDAALDASRDGDVPALTDALVATCRAVETPFDAVLLAQYSLAPTTGGLAEALGLPVVSGPTSAAATLRRQLLGDSSSGEKG
jgi:hypothetical protein